MHMHREVIKWIQSLDLSFQVKNPRRDLANGFIVAEILSRYDKEVSMHSIDTGLSMARRLDNWQQISKTLRRMGCRSITWDLMAHTLEARDGKGRELLELLFTFLTKKELKSNPAFTATKTVAQLPAYQRPTAAKLLRDQNDETCDRVSKLTGDLDEQRRHAANEQLLRQHREELQVVKTIEPDRFRPVPKTSQSADTAGGGSGGAGPDKSTASVGARQRPKAQITKELAVRTLDESILKAFAARDAAEREEAFRSGFDLHDDLATSLSRVCQRPLGAAGLLEQIDSLTNSDSGDYYVKFLQVRGRVPAEPRNATWAALGDSAKNIAKLVAARPDQFAHLVIGLGFVFGREAAVAPPRAVGDLPHALQVLARVGSECLNINPDVAAAAVRDHLVPAILPALPSAAPAFIERMAALLTSYTNCNHHDSVARLLSWLAQPLERAAGGAAPDCFYVLLARVAMSVDFGLCFGAAALFHRYAVAALHAASPTARAAAAHVMALLAPHDAALVLQSASTIAALTHSAGWEPRVAQLELLGTLLRHIAPAGDGAAAPTEAATSADDGSEPLHTDADDERAPRAAGVLDLVPVLRDAMRATLRSFLRAPAPVQRLALRATAPFVDATRDEELAREFLRQLITCDDVHRHNMLHPAPSSQALEPAAVEAIPGRARAFYPVGALYEVWHPPALADAVARFAADYSTFDVLTLLEPLALADDIASARDFWMDIAQALRLDLLSPIFNPANCRRVPEADLQACAEMAYSVATRLYSEVSGDTIEEGMHFEDLQEQAAEWLQANLGSV